ncbi:MAG: DUF6798 domain-containing protein [Chloroflexota bacterium]
MNEEVKFKKHWHEFLFWVLITLAFIVSFGGFFVQFHSNQNDHLIRGLAAGSIDSLADDWYVNTKNPMPVFGLLVQATAKFLHPSFFYFYQAAILGIYLFSLIGISDHFFHIRRSKFLFLSFIVVFLLTNTTSFLNLFKVQIFSGLADQDLGLNQFLPNVFGAFLFLSLFLFLKKKYVWAILALCLAGYFHPGYVLTAALLTASYILIIYLETKSIKTPILVALLALIVISPIVIYTFQANVGATSEQIHEAARIVVEERIPHHTQVNVWWKASETIKLLLCLLTLFIMRKTKLFSILLFGFLLTFTPIAALLIRPSNLVSLLQIWRVSVVLVPLSTILLLGALLSTLVTQYESFLLAQKRSFQALLAALTAFAIIQGAITQIDRVKAASQNPIRQLYANISQHRAPNTIYLIPPRDSALQGFRLGTGTPIFVDWKSQPWNTLEALEWYQRIAIADAFYADEAVNACKELPTIVSTYQITNLLAYTDQPLNCPGLKTIYQGGDYIVYQITTSD